MTWAQMEFGHEMHQRTNIMLINASEELIETLEDNQVCTCTYIHFLGTHTVVSNTSCLHIIVNIVVGS